jgi:hypothetical protein
MRIWWYHRFSRWGDAGAIFRLRSNDMFAAAVYVNGKETDPRLGVSAMHGGIQVIGAAQTSPSQ